MSAKFDQWKERKKRQASYTIKSIWKSRVQYAFLLPMPYFYGVFVVLSINIHSFTYYDVLNPDLFD